MGSLAEPIHAAFAALLARLGGEAGAILEIDGPDSVEDAESDEDAGTTLGRGFRGDRGFHDLRSLRQQLALRAVILALMLGAFGVERFEQRLGIDRVALIRVEAVGGLEAILEVGNRLVLARDGGLGRGPDGLRSGHDSDLREDEAGDGKASKGSHVISRSFRVA